MIIGNLKKKHWSDHDWTVWT